MRYSIEISETAEAEIEAVYKQLRKVVPMTAARWFARLEAAIHTLDRLPERCPLAPEGRKHQLPIRQFIFGKGRGAFRVLFVISDDCVHILHVVRGTRRFLKRDEFDTV